MVVTGVGGGAGSIALALLARNGYEVVAATGRPEELEEQLKRLGASSIIHRDELAQARRPLASEQWAGVIDGVGGDILAGAIAGVQQGGAVAAYGLAANADLTTTVLPFILRGVSLLGINSVVVSRELRQQAWNRLATDAIPELLDESQLVSR